MAGKCRNCDAPMKDERYCAECGADSKAKKFSINDDLVAENARLKAKIAELETPPPPAKDDDEHSDI